MNRLLHALPLLVVSNIVTILVAGAATWVALDWAYPVSDQSSKSSFMTSEFHRAMEEIEPCCDCETGEELLTCPGTKVPDEDGSACVCPEGTFLFLGDCLCFAGRATVETPSGARIPLSEVSVGDIVKTSQGYEQVYMFGHYAPNDMGQFLEITTVQDDPLLISESHLIRVLDGKYVPAGSLKVGDTLYDEAHSKTITVKKTRPVQEKGAYAPFTPSGTILVDNVESSCYVSHNGLGHVDVAGIQVSFQWMSHTFTFPFRVVCHYFGSKVCAEGPYNENGISDLVVLPLKYFQGVLQLSNHARIPILALVVVLGFFLQVTECVLFQQCWITMAAAVIAGGFYLAYYATGSKKVAP